MYKLFIFLFLSIFLNLSFASQFIRSIEYVVSPDMTLNEAKSNALKQLKIDILSEIGSLIESEIKSVSEKGVTIETINYSQVAAGSIKTTILNQAFDGATLFLEVGVVVNKKEILDILNRVYSFKKKEKEASRLMKRLTLLDEEKETIASENRLLKIKLNRIKKQIIYIEESKIASDFGSEKLKAIEDRLSLVKEFIEGRIISENNLAKRAIYIANEVYVDGIKFDEFNSIFPVTSINDYYRAKLSNNNCKLYGEEVNTHYMIVEYPFYGREILYTLVVNNLTGLVRDLVHFEYSASLSEYSNSCTIHKESTTL